MTAKATDALIPPHNLDAERAILGALLLRPARVIDCIERLRPDLFYRQAHQVIVRELRAYADAHGHGPDLVLLSNLLRAAGDLDAVGGPAYLASLLDGLPGGLDLDAHLAVLEGHAIKRRVMGMAERLLRTASDLKTSATDALADAEQSVLDLRQPTVAEWRTMADVMQDITRDLDTDPKDRRGAVLTGLWELDDLTGGMEPADFVLLAGRPSMAKTALAMGIARRVADRGAVVGVLSLEMAAAALGKRVLADEARINTAALFKYTLRERDYSRLGPAIGALAEAPIFVCDQSDLSVTDLAAKARRLKAQQPALALLIVDYLQLLEAPGENRDEQIARVSRRLKGLAKTLGVPVLVISQLSRACEARQDKRPMLSDLRDSGALEQDADQVWFLYRDAVYHDDADPQAAEVIVAKSRNGPTGVVPLRFLKEFTRFEDWSTP